MANIRNAETIEADEATGEIRRFSLADMPEWGPWLADRLSGHYPGFSRSHWENRIKLFMGGNDCLFIRNDKAVLLVSAAPRLLDGRIIVLEVFALSRDASPQYGGDVRLPALRDPSHRALMQLYRAAREWARSQKAARMFVGQCSDLTIKFLLEAVAAKKCGWVSVPL